MKWAMISAAMLIFPPVSPFIEEPGNWARAIPGGITDDEARALAIPQLREELRKLYEAEGEGAGR